MTGEIIHFKSHLDFKRAKLYREQAVPRLPAGRLPKEPRRTDPDSAAPSAETQDIRRLMARIAHLLEELQELTGIAALEGCIPEDGDGDPQPEIDRETLDRLYRNLNGDRAETFCKADLDPEA